MLRCKNIVYEYQPGVAVLRDVSLQVSPGEICGLFGRSGSGKTTLLNIIGGYLRPTGGEVSLDGKALDGPSWLLHPIYQEDSAWPWLTVRDNVLLANRFSDGDGRGGQSRRHYSRSEAESALQSVGLGAETWDRWPKELSVGMRKRVELARMLLYRPMVILADEPFAALDILTKRQLIQIVIKAREAYRSTILFSSHDLDDMVHLCERIFVLSGSPSAKIVATVENIYGGIVAADNEIEQKRVQIKTRLIGILEGAP